MICKGDGKYKICLTNQNIGDDLLVIITGGDEHIGGISLQECNSFATIGKKNHKDSYITKMVAPTIFNAFEKDVLIVCGIHMDDANKKDIETVINNTQSCVNEFIQKNI